MDVGVGQLEDLDDLEDVFDVHALRTEGSLWVTRRTRGVDHGRAHPTRLVLRLRVVRGVNELFVRQRSGRWIGDVGDVGDVDGQLCVRLYRWGQAVRDRE